MPGFDEKLREAITLQQTGRLDEAANAYRSLRDEQPDDARLLFYAGSLELQRGNASHALPLLEQLCRQEPLRIDAINALGHVYRRLERHAAAAALWEAYAGRAAADPRGHYELAACRLAMNDDDGARAALERFLASAGGTAGAELSVALAWHGAGRLAPAKRHYQRALALDSGLALARQNLAAAWQSEGELDRAEALYRAVLATEPANADVLRNLGTLHKDRGDLRAALEYYRDATLIERGPTPLQPDEILRRDPAARRTSLHSLRLEAEQLEHLLALGRIEATYRAVQAAYLEIIADLGGSGFTGHRRELDDAQFRRIGRTMHRLIHTGPTRAVADGALNPALDFADIEHRYRTSDGGVVVVDDFLTGKALAALRAYCLETTFWFDYTKAGGYSGAYMEQGFGNDLLLQLVTELRAAWPGLLGRHPLRQMWAYIYDAEMSGITAHADQAALNLNFWLTPDSANLDPDSGGLVVYTREAPANWDFRAYNSRPAEIEAFVRDSPSVIVPHRCNRLVMFNSNLIHKTDSFHFRPGLENRRINVTMLFGERPAHG